MTNVNLFDSTNNQFIYCAVALQASVHFDEKRLNVESDLTLAVHSLKHDMNKIFKWTNPVDFNVQSTVNLSLEMKTRYKVFLKKR